MSKYGVNFRWPGSSSTPVYGSNIPVNQLRAAPTPFNLNLAQIRGQGKSPAPFMNLNVAGHPTMYYPYSLGSVRHGATSGDWTKTQGMGIPRGWQDPVNIHPMASPKAWTDLNKMPGWKLPAGILASGAGIIGGAIELSGSGKPTPIEAHTEMLMADPHAVQSDGRTTMEHYIEKYGFHALPQHLKGVN